MAADAISKQNRSKTKPNSNNERLGFWSTTSDGRPGRVSSRIVVARLHYWVTKLFRPIANELWPVSIEATTRCLIYRGTLIALSQCPGVYQTLSRLRSLNHAERKNDQTDRTVDVFPTRTCLQNIGIEHDEQSRCEHFTRQTEDEWLSKICISFFIEKEMRSINISREKTREANKSEWVVCQSVG